MNLVTNKFDYFFCSYKKHRTNIYNYLILDYIRIFLSIKYSRFIEDGVKNNLFTFPYSHEMLTDQIIIQHGTS